MLRFLFFSALCSLIWVMGCGGGGGNSSTTGNNTIAGSANNVATITVNGGNTGLANGLFTSVTICSPGSTTNCATVPDILIDTGSTGLRILAEAIPGLTLPGQTDASGNSIGNCVVFADGFSWGQMVTADMTISGEKASSMPVHIINGSFETIPASCISAGGGIANEEDTVATFGSNGVLGVNNAPFDCGTACTVASTNPGIYFSCPSTGCVVNAQPLNQQAVNPATLFTTDNNGVIVELPGITSATGEASVTGALVFGIGTESNNGLGSATVLTTDPFGEFTTNFNGSNVTCGTAPNTTTVCSFTDSGSTLFFFSDSSITTCTLSASTFFCPSPTVNLTATNTGGNGQSTTINFSIANASTLFSTNSFAFNNIGAPESSVPNSTGLGFDWGVPFFYGRNVFVAIDGASTPAGAGPFIAY